MHRIIISLVAFVIILFNPMQSPAYGVKTPKELLTLENFYRELFKENSPSIVFISAGKTFGSGFFIRENCTILTNKHVVLDAESLTVITYSGDKYEGSVIEYAKNDIDLATVSIKKSSCTPLKMGESKSLTIGSWVASIGHGSGGIWTFNTGIVSNIYPNGDSKPVFQTEIPLNPGSSGGPIINSTGEVIGIVTAGLVESNNINFGIMRLFTINDVLQSTFNEVFL